MCSCNISLMLSIIPNKTFSSTYSLRIAYLVVTMTTDFQHHNGQPDMLLDFGGSIDHFLAPSIHLDRIDRHSLLETTIKRKSYCWYDSGLSSVQHVVWILIKAEKIILTTTFARCFTGSW